MPVWVTNSPLLPQKGNRSGSANAKPIPMIRAAPIQVDFFSKHCGRRQRCLMTRNPHSKAPKSAKCQLLQIRSPPHTPTHKARPREGASNQFNVASRLKGTH